MIQQDKARPVEVYRRDDPSVDPPTVALGLAIEQHLAEGDVVLFLDDEPDPARSFELHRLRGAFRLSNGIAPPTGCFASAQVAIREGWAMIDTLLSDADVGLGPDLPPLGALLDKPDPTGGAA